MTTDDVKRMTTSEPSESRSTNSRSWKADLGIRSWSWFMSALPPTLIVIIVLAAWEIAAAAGVLPDFVFSRPSRIALALWEGRSYFWENALVTMLELAVGLLLGVISGLLLGALVAVVPFFRRSIYPLMVGSQSLPFIVVGPILILWLGFGIASKIALVILVTFFPIAVGTVSGLQSVPPEALRFGRSLGAPKKLLFTKVQAPSALPQILVGLRVAATYAPLAAVFAEWIGAVAGLGSLLLRFNGIFRADRLLATVAIIMAVSLLLFASVGVLQRKLAPWAFSRPD